jgi:hypothetical protein
MSYGTRKEQHRSKIHMDIRGCEKHKCMMKRMAALLKKILNSKSYWDHNVT